MFSLQSLLGHHFDGRTLTTQQTFEEKKTGSCFSKNIYPISVYQAMTKGYPAITNEWKTWPVTTEHHFGTGHYKKHNKSRTCKIHHHVTMKYNI